MSTLFLHNRVSAPALQDAARGLVMHGGRV